jgi:hypothetical protein
MFNKIRDEKGHVGGSRQRLKDIITMLTAFLDGYLGSGGKASHLQGLRSGACQVSFRPSVGQCPEA